MIFGSIMRLILLLGNGMHFLLNAGVNHLGSGRDVTFLENFLGLSRGFIHHNLGGSSLDRSCPKVSVQQSQDTLVFVATLNEELLLEILLESQSFD